MRQLYQPELFQLRLKCKMVNKERLVKLIRRLIQINSENPPGDESRIAHFVKNYLVDLGLNVKIYEFQKKRSNLVVNLPGRNKKQTLLLSPHLDTVPAGGYWQHNPFRAVVENGRIYGRGASDDKGNLACALEVINSILEDKIRLDYNLLFAATADEECGSRWGLVPLLKRGLLSANFALILDSDDFKIIVAQKGLIHLKLKIQGKKAHGAYPWRGENAIEKAIEIIRQIKATQFSYVAHPLLKPPTINIGTIHGGDKVNIVSDWCESELDIRFLPGMSATYILENLKQIVKKYTDKFQLEVTDVQQPYEINRRHPLVRCLIRAVRQIRRRAEINGSEGATAMTFFQNKKIPAVAFGFGVTGCGHTSNEYIKITNLYQGALALENFLKLCDLSKI